MTKEEKLVSMLQPKDYKNKLRLYCKNCEFVNDKVAHVENNTYLRKEIIKIEEIAL